MGDELERTKQWVQCDKLGRTDQEKDTFQAVEAIENFYMKHFRRTFSEGQGCKWCFKISFHCFEEYIWENLYWRETELCSIFFFLRGCKYFDLLRSLFLRALCSAEKQPQKSLCFKKKKNHCLCRVKGEDRSFKLVSCQYVCNNVPGEFYTHC